MASDFMSTFDLSTRYATNTYARTNSVQSDAYQSLIDAGYTIQDSNDTGLAMDDFLQLMIQQFQNQTMDNTASTTDMMNQLVQMSVVQAITDVQKSIATMVDASTMSYSASLVGKTVTIGQYGADGTLQEIVGEVQGTGTYQNQQVIFVNGNQYYLNEIMAVGTLPDGALNSGDATE